MKRIGLLIIIFVLFSAFQIIGVSADQMEIGYNNITAETYRSDSANNYGFQHRWDISDIPSSVIITNVEACFFQGSPDFPISDSDSTFHRINNQTWPSGITTAEWDALSETDIMSSYTWNSTGPGWDCLNVTPAIKTDYDASNTYSTYRIEDTDNILGSGGTTYSEASSNRVGDTDGYMDLGGEGYWFLSQDPYMTVDYTPDPLPGVTLVSPVDGASY
ncbi:MAG: hypothetical protein ABIJ92_02465, partial [Candidatus Aenigmatarchaeota archaeon]